MMYEYQCEECGCTSDHKFPIGKAEKTVKCHECGKDAKRMFSISAIAVNDSPVSFSNGRGIGQDMLKKNLDAAKRMQGHKPKVRRVATDYGNGDVREGS